MQKYFCEELLSNLVWENLCDQESKKHFAMDKRSQRCDPNVDNIVEKFYEKDF